jgi:dTDP-glucose 4,6-dehydratase
MRLLVTGGAGFIGSAFVRRRLASTDDRVVVLDKLTYAGNLENLATVARDEAETGRYAFVRGDIADPDVVGRLVAECDAVLNFAAESHVDRSILDPTSFLRTDVLGVQVLLEAIRTSAEGGRQIRFVQVSTDEVYGSIASGFSREGDQLAPRSPYAAAKAGAELLVGAYRTTYALDCLVTRGSNTYGPYQHPEKVVPLFVTNALEDRPLPLYGDGMQRRDWLFVDDHADAIGLVLDRGQPGEVYNVAGGQERTNREMTAAILEQLGKPWTLVRSVPDRPGHDRRYAMDGARLEALGWRPRVDFDEGIQRTVAWFRDNPEWWRAIKRGDWNDYYERQYGERLASSVEA